MCDLLQASPNFSPTAFSPMGGLWPHTHKKKKRLTSFGNQQIRRKSMKFLNLTASTQPTAQKPN